jgi:hypothetical protein
MKRKKLKTFSFVNPIYDYRVFIRVGGTKDEAITWASKKFDCNFGSSKPSQACAFLPEDDSSHMIWFKDIPGGGVVSHESLHSAAHVLRHVGVGPLTDETEEAYTYLTGWTAREIGRRLWK